MIKLLSICSLAGSLSFLAGIQAVHADSNCPFELVDGEITEHDFAGFRGTIRVSVPDEAPPIAGYPVIVYYHGWSTGLKPNLRIMHAVTGGDDYLLIGMSYRSRYFYEELDRKSLRKEQSHLDRVLGEISKCRPVNLNTVFLAGYSQGGYAISMIGEQRLDRVAGLILLGSGRRWAKMYLPDENEIKGWPIFIGAGDKDERHFPIAKDSALLYAVLGAEVSMETWPDTDHIQGWGWYQKDPQRGVGLKAWLDDIVSRRTASTPEASGK
jgi:pimeloyl-ACP methyl ester carboxylesterase